MTARTRVVPRNGPVIATGPAWRQATGKTSAPFVRFLAEAVGLEF
jgi:hypothetical protein